MDLKETQGRAYAKINLHLQVEEQRADGFHNLLSLFQLIDLYDELKVTVTPDTEFRCTIVGMPAVPLLENTLYRSALLFYQQLEERGEVEIEIKKQIPLQAGLGGGSSDAACLLLLLNQLYGHVFSTQLLWEIALQVGSDVPFFLSQATAAVVTGRGEHVEPIIARSDLFALLVTRDEKPVSTREAFAALSRERFRQQRLVKQDLQKLYQGPAEHWPFRNDFYQEDQRYHTFQSARTAHGSPFATLSGSGSAFVIISEQREQLERIKGDLSLIPGETAQIVDCLS